MQPDMVEAVGVVRQSRSQLRQSVEPSACNEFCLDHFEC